MRRFVILAAPRTGSNLLCTLLNSHPRILCHHEVFNPRGVFAALDYRGQALAIQSLRERDDDPLAFLDRVWQTGTEQDCIGFKWTRGQIEVVLNRVVADAGIEKIVLRRRNRIKTFVSEKIAQETQQWEVYSPQELAMPRPRIHVDLGPLHDHISINERFYARLASELSENRQPHLDVVYESLFDSDVQAQLLEFLGIAQVSSLKPASVKQNSMDLRDTIANFDELRDCLSDSQLTNELHDLGI